MATRTDYTVVVSGLKQLGHAAEKMENGLGPALAAGLTEAASLVANETSSLLNSLSYTDIDKTAAGVKPQVSAAALRNGQAFVVQTLRKSSNPSRRRRNWGGIQFSQGFLPALQAKEGEVTATVEALITRLADEF